MKDPAFVRMDRSLGWNSLQQKEIKYISPSNIRASVETRPSQLQSNLSVWTPL